MYVMRYELKEGGVREKILHTTENAIAVEIIEDGALLLCI